MYIDILWSFFLHFYVCCAVIVSSYIKYWINFVSYNEEVLWLLLTHKLFIMIDSQKKKKKKKLWLNEFLNHMDRFVIYD